MFKRTIFLAVFIFVTATLFSQAPLAKKPTIMVVPSTLWCLDNGYYQSLTANGKTEQVPDYKQALESNRDINIIITQMGKIMADRGFPLQDLQATLNSIASSEVEMSLITGNTTGSFIVETPIEMYNRQAKADIIINVDFQTVKQGPRSHTTFNVRALDAYTNKQISGVQGGGSQTSAPVDMQLNAAVLDYMDSFTAQLQNHFNDLFANGREVTISLMKFASSPIDFETEFDYNGQEAELADILGVWFEENTVNGRFNVSTRSTNRMVFDQVRMPLMGKSLSGKEVTIDATAFVRSLVSMLKKEPYNSPVKIYQKGLGEVWLIVGEK